ncbi:MAG: PD-(D/E)XK nuclease family protein [Bacteroidota bacterium]|nr:PD-(D/E)XK nuclease family protein [Bacteroidota bacterium]
MKYFLDKIAERIISKYPEDMDRIAVVLPNKRAIVFLKNYLSNYLEKPQFLPRFFSIDEFIVYISGLEIIDNISLQFQLYNSYLINPPEKNESFSEFLRWSQVLLQDFNEVDRNLVDACSIFSNLKDVKKLENWEIDNWSLSQDVLSDTQKFHISFYQHIYNWYQEFRKILLHNNVAYQGMAYRKAAEDIVNKNLNWEKIWFVGLNALTKSEQHIIDYLKKEDIARVFWDADKFYYNNELHEAGGFLRKQRKRWHEIDFDGVGDYFSIPKEVFNIIGCPKNVAQTNALSQILSKLPYDEIKNSDTAVVLANEGLLYPVLNHFPEIIDKVNITMGAPLRNTSLFSFIDTFLNMHLHANDYKKNKFYYKDVIAFLQHPYTFKLFDKEDLFKCKDDIVKKNLIFINSDYLSSRLPDLNLIFNLWETISDALSSLFLLVDALRDSIINKEILDAEILYNFYKCLTLINNQVNNVSFKIDIKTLYVLLKEIVSKQTIPFQGEPLEGLQVMGVLETRTLDFKNVIILSSNEGYLPQLKSFNSFIPYDLRKYFGIPVGSDKDAVFSYHFYRLLQRASRIFLLYDTEPDNFGSGEKSRFIQQLEAEYTTSVIKNYIFHSDRFQLTNSEDIFISRNSVAKEISAWFLSGVSPSALNRYNNCSLSFYYYYLAKIRRDDEVEEFADSSVLGESIHKALELYLPLGNITAEAYRNIKNDIINSIEDNFKQILKQDKIIEGKNYLNLQVAKKMAKDFLLMEEQLVHQFALEGKHLHIIEKELELTSKICIDGHDVNLKGVVDRIDVLGDTIRIVDYKTGRVTKEDLYFKDFGMLKDPKKSKALQVFMYAYLYLKDRPETLDKKVIAGNYSFKNLQHGLLSLSIDKNNVRYINQEVLNEFEYILKDILQTILNNDFVKTTDLQRCKWCEYRNICNR